MAAFGVKSRLARSKLTEFIDYLDKKGIENKKASPTDCAIHKVKTKNGWQSIYDGSSPVHLSVNQGLLYLVTEFSKSTKTNQESKK